MPAKHTQSRLERLVVVGAALVGTLAAVALAQRVGWVERVRVALTPSAAAAAPDGACGNGQVDPGEQCDGPIDPDLTCGALDATLAGGELRCDPASCTFDTSACTPSATAELWPSPRSCGNGALDPGEQCDRGASWEGKKCGDVALGFARPDAPATCDLRSCRWDLRACAPPPPVCGNGAAEGGESCDGQDLRGATCLTVVGPRGARYAKGTLRCDRSCMLDYRGCLGSAGERCGDGRIDSSLYEECDGLSLGHKSCANLGRVGFAACTSRCTMDYSGCLGGCNVRTGVACH